MSLICWLDSTALLIPETKVPTHQSYCVQPDTKGRHTELAFGSLSQTTWWSCSAGSVVTVDSAPAPCSHPLSSQKHACFTTQNLLGHLCIPETGSGQMRGEDSEKDTCLLGASQITKDLKPLILWILKIVSNYANGERRPTGTS